MTANFTEKLIAVQSSLVAPKSQTNTFGKYKYRSCEDVLEALKPLLKENGLFLSLSDEIVEIGGRVYVKAIATVTDGENEKTVSSFAREALDKKGMDESQITGATSSYARKYALNGLFGIDDSKDSDHTNKHEDKPKSTQKEAYDFEVGGYEFKQFVSPKTGKILYAKLNTATGEKSYSNEAEYNSNKAALGESKPDDLPF